MSQTCPATLMTGRRRGQVCGRPVKGYIARGHGRCGDHLTTRERVRAVAVIRAERELRELRGLDREFEVEGFMDPALDE